MVLVHVAKDKENLKSLSIFLIIATFGQKFKVSCSRFHARCFRLIFEPGTSLLRQLADSAGKALNLKPGILNVQLIVYGIAYKEYKVPYSDRGSAKDENMRERYVETEHNFRCIPVYSG